jgi:TorA maturation chaperone TorD
MTEALRALAVLLEAPGPEHAAIAAALELPAPPTGDEHTSVVVFQAYPYASVYLGAEGMLGGEARDRVAGFWRALGGEPPAEPDHLSVLLAGIAALDEPAAAAPPGADGPAGRGAHAGAPDVRSSPAGAAPASPRLRLPVVASAPTVRAALFWEHVASWMPPYLATVRRIGGPFHVAWAELAATLLDELAGDLGPPARLPLALRAAPAPPAAPADLDELLATLLAPARTGFVVVCDDLERAAADLGLGLRAGERRFALRALLGQAPAAVLGWLAAEARAQAASFVTLPPVSAWWVARAHVGATWLDGLAAVARREDAPVERVTR